jgi:beta-lactam-binding protein with PASTA domain
MWRTLPPMHDVHPGMPGDGAGRPPSGAIAPARPDPAGSAQPPGTLNAPDLRGMSVRDALRIGRMAELQVQVTTHPAERALWDRVVAQDPAPDVAMSPGEAVTITVGARPAVQIPDLRGRDEEEVVAILRDAGLRPDRRLARRSNSIPEGHIVRTRPRAGSTVPQGTSVAYVVATSRPLHTKHARRHERRARAHGLPDGSFLSLPSDD